MVAARVQAPGRRVWRATRETLPAVHAALRGADEHEQPGGGPSANAPYVFFDKMVNYVLEGWMTGRGMVFRYFAVSSKTGAELYKTDL